MCRESREGEQQTQVFRSCGTWRLLEGICPRAILFQKMLPDYKVSTAKGSLKPRQVHQGHRAECKQGAQSDWLTWSGTGCLEFPGAKREEMAKVGVVWFLKVSLVQRKDLGIE